MRLKNGQVRFIFASIAICILLIPFYHWVTHPYLTEMEVLQEFLWHYISAIGVMLLGYLFQNDLK